MKTNLFASLIIALSVIIHGIVTSPLFFAGKSSSLATFYSEPSRDAFSAEAIRAVTSAFTKAIPAEDFKGVEIHDIRFSQDRKTVGVKYKVLMPAGGCVDWVVYKGDEIGRFIGYGKFANVEINSKLNF